MIHEENGQIIVDELRPMSEARELGIGRCLAVFVDYPQHFKFIKKVTNEHWSDIEGDWWHKDSEFIGFMPMPIYQPKDGE